VSEAVSPVPRRQCAWCRQGLEVGARRDQEYCGQRCRQAAWRLARRRQLDGLAKVPLRLAYADPPYPGKAHLYRDQPTFGGEVDHAALIRSLTTRYDGWALSTSAESLRDVLPLCPPEARVCSWIKPHGASTLTYGLHNCWEPLIVVQARRLRPGRRDCLVAQAARGGGDLIGRKPIAFAAWLFDCLGALPGDSLDDLFPGTGIIGRAWANLSRAARADGSLVPGSDMSADQGGDVSPTDRADGSLMNGRPVPGRRFVDLALPAPNDSSFEYSEDPSFGADCEAYPGAAQDGVRPSPGDGFQPGSSDVSP